MSGLKRFFYLVAGQVRSKFLRLLLGERITIFVKEVNPGYYDVEIADSQKRIKLMVLEFHKVSSTRFRLIGYRLS